MFGYIRPLRPMLRICEDELYKGVYCGLCKELSHISLLSRFILNYDMVFYALVLMSCDGERACAKKQVCIAHPFKKRPCVHSNNAMKRAAHLTVILFYYKLLDNISDSRGFKRWIYSLAPPLFRRAHEKCARLLPNAENAVKKLHAAQTVIENKPLPVTLDEAAEPFALCMQTLFSDMAKDEKSTRILSRMGYFLGRWVYLLDAADDLEDDTKTGSFNVLNGKDDPTESVLGSLNMSLSELTYAYNLLDTHEHKGIIDNIIYLGLKKAQETIVSR